MCSRELGRNARLRGLRVLVASVGLVSMVLVASPWGHRLRAASLRVAAYQPAQQASEPPSQGKTETLPPASLEPHQLSKAEAALQYGTLTVWVPRTFVRGVVPKDHEYDWDTWVLAEFKHDFPNFDLRFEVLEREQLEQAMHSPPDEHFPDVALIANVRELRPLQDADSVVTMWGGPRVRVDGWWVIFRQTTNLTAAEAFLLWLEHPLHFKPSWSVSTTSISRDDVAAVQALSQEAVRDYVDEDPDELWSTMDPVAAHFQSFAMFGRNGTVTPISIEPLLTFGSSRLAFVLLAATGEGDSTFGMIHSGVILRNTGEGWKVLHLVPVDSLPRLEDLFSSFDRLGVEERAAEAIPEVKLIGPPDHAQLPQFPHPQMEWAKLDAKLATYVFEFQQRLMGKEGWERSYIVLISPGSNAPTLRTEWSHAAGRWRVWAISKAGVVSISEWRGIDLTYSPKSDPHGGPPPPRKP
ncbi:MAG: hypothetical protein ACLQOO_15400 [Terriglobia bacterium]